MHRFESTRPILSDVDGALFFGVPRQGMAIESMIPMAHGQPNEPVLNSVCKDSQLLREQNCNFVEAFDSRDPQIVCFYGTAESPTARRVSHARHILSCGIVRSEPMLLRCGTRWKMVGPPEVLVSVSSATHCRQWEVEAHNAQAID